MIKDRLTLLADRLVRVNPDKFNLGQWFCNTIVEDEGDPCGFAGCAVGYACVMPEFNALGLHRPDAAGQGQWRVGEPVFTEPGTGTVYESWAAVRAFFDLTPAEAVYLFQDYSYEVSGHEMVSPEMVAARLRSVVAAGFPESAP